MQEDKKIKAFLDEGTDMETLDKTLKSWITQTMDDELRDELTQTLNEKYAVKRTAGKSFVLRHIRPILATAASLALLISLYMVNQNDITPNALATQYLDSQTIQHPGGFKGAAASDVNRTRGIVAFNNGDFDEAALEFEKIVAPNAEDSHYLGLAHLKSGQYQKAIEHLKKGASENSRFREEARWFLSLAYFLDGQDTAAKQQLRQIREGEWQFDKARELLKKLEH